MTTSRSDRATRSFDELCRPPACRAFLLPLSRKVNVKPRILLAAVALASCAATSAAEPPTREEAPVRINDIKNPELKPYKVMLAGQEAFDDNRDLAPKAKELRFKLRPKEGAADAIMEGLTLRLAGDDGSIPVPFDAAGTFMLPRDASAAGRNADLVLNKKKGDYRWQPDIHSEGVPAGMRRLGDLRLECKVLVAVAKEEIPFWASALVTSILLTRDWCGSEKLNLLTHTPYKLKGAALVEGERRQRLHLRDNGKGFLAPFGDRSWSDEAMVELQPAEQ